MPRQYAHSSGQRQASLPPHAPRRGWGLLTALAFCGSVHAAAMPPQAPSAAAPAGPRLVAGQTPTGVTPADWGSVQQQISAHQHRFVAQADGSVRADSPQQGWQARFDHSGMVLLHGGQTATPWQMRLRLHGVGYGKALAAPGKTPAMTMQGDQLHYRWSQQLTEWWTNGAQGMEQWFKLEQAPSGKRTADDRLTLKPRAAGRLPSARSRR